LFLPAISFGKITDHDPVVERLVSPALRHREAVPVRIKSEQALGVRQVLPTKLPQSPVEKAQTVGTTLRITRCSGPLSDLEYYAVSGLGRWMVQAGWRELQAVAGCLLFGSAELGKPAGVNIQVAWGRVLGSH